MRIKKIVSIFLTAALLISVLPIIGSAETTETFKVGVEAMTAASTVSASPVIYNQGDAVTVEIRASQNTGVSALKLIIDYNEDALTPVAGDACGLLQESDSLTHHVTDGDGYFVFYTLSTTEFFDTLGVLARITFTAKETCIDDTAVTVRLFGDSGSCGKFTVTGFVPVPLTSETRKFSIHKIDTATSVVTPPTCTVDGWTTHTCVACEQPVIGNVVPMKGHDPAEAKEENRVEATCTTDGSYDLAVYCKTEGCGVELSRTNHVIPATGHDPAEAVEENRVEATCTTDGSYDVVIYCKTEICGAELSRTTEVIPATGHTADEPKEENRVEATCTANGSYDVVIYCKTEGCGAEISRTPQVIPATGHDAAEAVEENKVAATCTTAGSYDLVVYCKTEGCGAELLRTNVPVPATGHTAGEAKEENHVAPTIAATGSYDLVVYCQTCEAELSRETVTVPSVIPADGWHQESGKWYFFSNGAMVKNSWQKDSIGWCYLSADGSMATNKWVKDSVGWCYVGADGYCVTDKWVKDSIGWCYLDADGRMATNKWVKDSVGWCYVGADGYCVTNAWREDSIGWCYLDAEGRMVINDWVLYQGSWYYLDANGYMLANTSRNIGGKVYRFNDYGICTNP